MNKRSLTNILLTMTFLSLVFFSPCNAQIRVLNNGKIGIGTLYPQSQISMNSSGNNNYYAYYNGVKKGLFCQTDSNELCAEFKLYNANSSFIISALNGSAHSSATLKPYHGSGVSGFSMGSSYNAGVTGYSYDNYNGAGIAGSSTLVCVWNDVNKNYAGYFYGDVKITNDLLVNGSITGTILGASVPQSSRKKAITLDSLDRTTAKISKLRTSVYHLDSNQKKKKMLHYTIPSFIAEESLPHEIEELPNIIEDQRLSKSHYTLDTEQLEEVFPELVYEQEDGTKSINYMEMIPLLVQTISELNSRLSTLEGSKRERITTKSPISADVATECIPMAKLHQNTPNPFTERTTIRFSLPGDVRNAYIYIFDIQGKMLRQLSIDPSMQSVSVNGYELQAGIYLYSLVVNGQEIDTKRMILSK